MTLFDQEKYIETSKAIVKEFVIANVGTEIETPVAMPDITSETLSLTKPTVFIEYVRDLNIDPQRGKNTGINGRRRKRKRLTFALYVITQGDNRSVLERDRIVQKLQAALFTPATTSDLAGKGVYELDMTYMGSHRARENVHLARLEMYFVINFIN